MESLIDNKKSWDYIKLTRIIVVSGFMVIHLLSNNRFGTGKFDASITDTRNMIAYTQFAIPARNGERNKEDIYLLNVKTGITYQLTDDRYQYVDLSWSFDGNRLLFTSKRNTKRAALWDETKNPAYVCIYDFNTKKEIILEENIAEEVHRLALDSKEKGYVVYFEDEKYSTTSNVNWIGINLIGFMREIPIGLGSGYKQICTSDTLGKNLKVYRDFSKFPKWNISRPQWINEDSVLVILTKFGFIYNDPYMAFFLPKQNKFIFSDEWLNVNDPGVPFLSYDRKKLLYYKYNEKDTLQIIEDIYSGKKEQVSIDRLPKRYVLSPNGKKIAFLKKIGYDWDIYIMDVNGTNIQRMTFDGGAKESLAWSPNSDY